MGVGLTKPKDPGPTGLPGGCPVGVRQLKRLGWNESSPPPQASTESPSSGDHHNHQNPFAAAAAVAAAAAGAAPNNGFEGAHPHALGGSSMGSTGMDPSDHHG